MVSCPSFVTLAVCFVDFRLRTFWVTMPSPLSLSSSLLMTWHANGFVMQRGLETCKRPCFVLSFFFGHVLQSRATGLSDTAVVVIARHCCGPGGHHPLPTTCPKVDGLAASTLVQRSCFSFPGLGGTYFQLLKWVLFSCSGYLSWCRNTYILTVAAAGVMSQQTIMADSAEVTAACE